ncbi:MAG: hypothetical protein AB7F88_14340 [Pyrinomonadaceae bacterium]
MVTQKQKFSRRSIAVFWLAIVSITIGILIWLEQIAILYVLATVALVVLLLIVAFANLEKVGEDGLEGPSGS